MPTWMLALILKPLFAVLFVAFWFFVVVLGLRWIYPRLPKSKLVDALFRERGSRTPDYGPGSAWDRPDRGHDRSLTLRR